MLPHHHAVYLNSVLTKEKEKEKAKQKDKQKETETETEIVKHQQALKQKAIIQKEKALDISVFKAIFHSSDDRASDLFNKILKDALKNGEASKECWRASFHN